MPIRGSPNGVRHTRPQAGRDRPERVVAINRSGWSQSVVAAGRDHPVRAAWVAAMRSARRPKHLPKLGTLPLHATGEGAERGTAPQYVAPGRYYIVDLARRQPKSGGNSLKFGRARSVKLIKAETTDKELQVATVLARAHA